MHSPVFALLFITSRIFETMGFTLDCHRCFG